jgi:hypothetical protein
MEAKKRRKPAAATSFTYPTTICLRLQKSNAVVISHVSYTTHHVHNLPQGDETVTVLWSISVVKYKGNIDDLGYLSGGTATECWLSCTTRQINLIVL